MHDDLLTLIHAHQRFVLTTHRRPDGDAVGSTVAMALFLQKLGKDAVIYSHDAPAHNLTWMDGADLIHEFTGSVEELATLAAADVLLILDTNAVDRLGNVGTPLRNSGGVKVLIDHHTKPENWFDLTIRRESASSTGELVYEIIAAEDPNLIDTAIAQALYTAIMTDTGSFRFSNVTATVHRVVADLLERGAFDPDPLHADIFDVKTEQSMRLMGKALDSLVLLHDGHVGHMRVTSRMLRETDADRDDTEGFVNMILAIEGVRVALLFIETDSGVKVSFRSKGDWHVHTWAQSFGGGGHRNASGAYLNGTLDDIIHTVLTAAPSYLPLDESEADQEEDDSDLLQAFMNKQTHRAT